MTEPLRVGTRGSPLALAQTEEALSRLRAAHPDLATLAETVKRLEAEVVRLRQALSQHGIEPGAEEPGGAA